MNRYWIPNIEINKKVITQELQFYLGPDAHVRPYTRAGEDGFLITTPGPCLTDEQIDDICEKSREVWKQQAEARSIQEADKVAKSDKPLKRPLNQPILVSRGGAPLESGLKTRERDERRRATSRKRTDDRRYDDDSDRHRSGDERRGSPYQGDRWRDDRYR